MHFANRGGRETKVSFGVALIWLPFISYRLHHCFQSGSKDWLKAGSHSCKTDHW